MLHKAKLYVKNYYMIKYQKKKKKKKINSIFFIYTEIRYRKDYF